MPHKKPYITTLTPLRGIAALLVLIYHSNLMVMQFHSSNVNFMSGWLWVDFFFVLSGFIIFYVYGQSFKGSKSPRTIGNISRRVLLVSIRSTSSH